MVLRLSNLHKTYGDTKALNGVSFEVPEGAVFGILGPNGSGKTTLLGIILDVLKADSGHFSWFGESPMPGQRKRIGTLLETPNFYHYLSAEKNHEITRQISGRGTKNDIGKVLKKVKLYERRKSGFSTYSLGMKQRLAIASALLGSPAVIVLDEPTNGLDPVGIAEMRSLILELKAEGHTVIMASHLLDEVEKICTHVAIMKKGMLLACGGVEEILVNDDVVEIGAKNVESLLAAIGELPGLLHYTIDEQKIVVRLPRGTADLEAINGFWITRGIVLNHLSQQKQRLEAKFFELTQN
jgi:ABC-2 type transport system ATP-binding protein